jgi:hypothetical protein
MRRPNSIELGSIAPATGALDEAVSLNIAVIYNSVDFTLSALRKAGALANSLHARITLIVPQTVPFPLPLVSPPVERAFKERAFRVLADEGPVDTSVHIYLCRDRLEMLRNVLQPHSLIVIGGKDCWWPTREKRLADQLRRMGHHVVLVQS